MPSDLALAPLQQWMQAVVTHPGDVYEALASPEVTAVAADVGEVVLPSRTLEPLQRVGIYHGMYMMRMVEALEIDYPALAHFLGADAFDTLIRGYVQKFPSRSYTLNRLGDHLPEYVAQSGLRRQRFLHDLARLELAMTQVFDEEACEPLPADAIASVPPDRVEAIRFTPVPGLRLLALDYDSNAAFQAFRNEEHMHPQRRKTYLAVHRSDYAVMRMPLSYPPFAFLRTLVFGKTIADALTDFRRRFHRFPQQEELFTWFRDWSAAGLFATISDR